MYVLQVASIIQVFPLSTIYINCKWWPTRCNYFGLFIYS